MTEKPKKQKNWLFYLVIVLLVVAVIYMMNNQPSGKSITYSEFQDKVVAGEVTHVKTVGNTVYIRIKDSKITEANFIKGKKGDFTTTFINSQELIEFMNDYNNGQLTSQNGVAPTEKVVVSYNLQGESLLSQLLPYLSIGAVIIVAIIIVRTIAETSSKNMAFGKSRARNVERSKVKFSDVAGSEEEKEELKEIVDFLKNPRKYTELGARIPKGVLLVGSPGTGKTLLAKAIAGECNAPFFSISGSDFVEMYVGVGASRVRDLFDQAKRSAPCIIFIDEIDAVGRQRGAGLGGGNDEREQTLNQLLVQMDGFEANEGIIVIAATNRPDVLDPALMRPGRFDRQVYINMPDVKAREKILKVHARNKKFTDDVDLENIAKLTSGFSGADLENLLNEAAILAGRDNRVKINMIDIQEAVNKVIMGPQKKSRVVTERDREITAFHEAGHAILHKKLEFCDEVQEVSIIPRGMAGGYTLSRPDTDDNYATLNKLNDMIASFMGGRIAESIRFGDITTGASNDIEQATKIARKMVTELGMSADLKFINLGSSSEVFIGRDYQTQVLYSDDTASKIDAEILKILNYNYERAEKILKDNWDKITSLSELLLKKNVAYKEELDSIMEGKSVKQIIANMNRKENKKKKQQEKERQEKILQEQKRLEEIKAKTLLALKNEGLLIEKPIEKTENKQILNENDKKDTKND
ncbi:MAG: ATP-dependent zinc metalloprotease FtsH [Clostridiales bacterium]|nr:ATP-dependent zinc metalloprotease FtsH [Clostridiales bacterium]